MAKLSPQAKVKAAIKDLPFEEKVRVLADTLKHMGLPNFAGHLLEGLAHARKHKV